MFGKSSVEEVEKFLHEQFIGHIACHADGLTYVVPISYAYDGTYIYCHSLDGMKINMMRKNPQVCFEVDNTKNLANWQSVICWGIFQELKSEHDQKKAMTMLEERTNGLFTIEMLRLSPQWPFTSDEDKMKGVFFRVRLIEKTGRFEKSSAEYIYSS